MVAHNLVVIPSTDEHAIAESIKNSGNPHIHCTNGTYAYGPERVVPTTLAGFQYVSDNVAKQEDSFLVAVNSDASMAGIMDAKNASQAERDTLETQGERAGKFAQILAEQFPDRTIFIAFYDKSTPTDLYKTLFDEGISMGSLHKHGYGTNPNAPKIEGADYFGKVLAFPLPNDTKPVCYSITPTEDQTDVVSVVKLQETEGSHGKPYLSTEGKVLFPVPKGAAAYYDDGTSIGNPWSPKPAF